MNVIFMDEAMDDLHYLREFLLSSGVPGAFQIIDRVIASTEQLRAFPRMGTAVEQSPEFGDVRDLFSGQYCLRYACYSDCIYILRVWHQRENQRNL